MSAARLPVVLLWHMHQPQYRDALTGRYLLPWTYLHAIKDYVDMVAHLEANAGARAVVNFTPVLIEQLQDYAAQIAAHLDGGAPLSDPLLALLGDAPPPSAAAPRLALLQSCLRAHREHLIARYDAYARLVQLAGTFGTLEHVCYASDQYLQELAMWYHLAWLGETVKRSDARVAAWIGQARDFTPVQRRGLLALIGELIGGLLPRYRRLADEGRIELSTSPYAHPLTPLLIDFRAARESVADAPLPQADHYPGGRERADWHMSEAVRAFTRTFGAPPRGCWPSEGAISRPTLELIDGHGLAWFASSESVLRGCLTAGETVSSGTPLQARSAGGSGGPGCGDGGPGDNGGSDGRSADAQAAAAVLPHSPAVQVWRVPGQQLCGFFRHDALSDLIGFTYSSWHADDAVGHFVAQLERLAAREDGADRCVLIALDGENAWEHYPFNGYYFLQGLYAALAAHPRLELTTPSAFLARAPAIAPLPHVTAGSWVHGTLSTWIGDADKNRGWDLLVEARQAFDAAMAAPLLSAEERAAAARQLGQCESSDWFWWFGDYNPYEAVRDFDWLYRQQLASLYRLLRQPVPPALAVPVSVGRGAPEAGGVMRRASE